MRSYFKAVDDGRWDDVLALFHDDGVLNVAGRRAKVGHERIRPFYENIGTRFDTYGPTVTGVFADGSLDSATAAAFLTLNAVSAAGEPIEVPAADDFRIEGGKIRSLQIIFDTNLMR